MEILSVIVTNRHTGEIISIDSKTTSEKHVARKGAITQMEGLFISKCTSNGISEADASESIEDGYMEIGESEMVSLVWS
tara:strand:+ start:135 stop:371 length:237 start_codon:yes stop_codon:yes gene_type:complete